VREFFNKKLIVTCNIFLKTNHNLKNTVNNFGQKKTSSYFQKFSKQDKQMSTTFGLVTLRAGPANPGCEWFGDFTGWSAEFWRIPTNHIGARRRSVLLAQRTQANLSKSRSGWLPVLRTLPRHFTVRDCAPSLLVGAQEI